MSYNSTTHILTAPVGIGDISQALGTSSTDLGTLCRSNKIKKWNKYKPEHWGVAGQSAPVGFLTEAQRRSNHWGMKWRPAENATLKDFLERYPIAFNYEERTVGEVKRIADFVHMNNNGTASQQASTASQSKGYYKYLPFNGEKDNLQNSIIEYYSINIPTSGASTAETDPFISCQFRGPQDRSTVNAISQNLLYMDDFVTMADIEDAEETPSGTEGVYLVGILFVPIHLPSGVSSIAELKTRIDTAVDGITYTSGMQYILDYGNNGGITNNAAESILMWHTVPTPEEETGRRLPHWSTDDDDPGEYQETDNPDLWAFNYVSLKYGNGHLLKNVALTFEEVTTDVFGNTIGIYLALPLLFNGLDSGNHYLDQAIPNGHWSGINIFSQAIPSALPLPIEMSDITKYMFNWPLSPGGFTQITPARLWARITGIEDSANNRYEITKVELQGSHLGASNLNVDLIFYFKGTNGAPISGSETTLSTVTLSPNSGETLDGTDGGDWFIPNNITTSYIPIPSGTDGKIYLKMADYNGGPNIYYNGLVTLLA